MTFKQLIFVVEVAKLGSINKAAKSLYTSQSNISNSIKELETQLGFSIFKRSNRGVIATDKGKEFLSHADTIILQKEKIEQHYIKGNKNEFSGFRVSTLRFPFAVSAFINFIKNKNTDELDIRICECGAEKVIEDVALNKCDIGVIVLTELTHLFITRYLKSKHIEFHPIKKVRPQVFFRKGHPLAKEKSVDVNSLYNYPYVTFIQDDGTPLEFAEEVPIHGLSQTKSTIRINDRSTVYNVLTNTDGFSIGTGIIPLGYGDKDIVTRRIKNNNQFMTLGWIKLQSSPTTNEIEEYVDLLKAEL